jgi:hypothetical protein
MVATSQHGHLVDRAQEAERAGPLRLHRAVARALRPRAAPSGRPVCASPPGHHDVGLPGGDGHGGMPDSGAAGAAAEADLGEVGDVPRPDRLGHGDLVRRLHGERGEAVDLGRGAMPASRSAATTASAASWPSGRSISLANSVCPMPTMAAASRSGLALPPMRPNLPPGPENTTGRESGDRKAIPSMWGASASGSNVNGPRRSRRVLMAIRDSMRAKCMPRQTWTPKPKPTCWRCSRNMS